MADGDPGDWKNGKTETYEISTANWRGVNRDRGRLVRRCIGTSVRYDILTPIYRRFFPHEDVKCSCGEKRQHII
jgi:hypothetical protein